MGLGLWTTLETNISERGEKMILVSMNEASLPACHNRFAYREGGRTKTCSNQNCAVREQCGFSKYDVMIINGGMCNE